MPPVSDLPMQALFVSHAAPYAVQWYACWVSWTSAASATLSASTPHHCLGKLRRRHRQCRCVCRAVHNSSASCACHVVETSHAWFGHHGAAALAVSHVCLHCPAASAASLRHGHRVVRVYAPRHASWPGPVWHADIPSWRIHLQLRLRPPPRHHGGRGVGSRELRPDMWAGSCGFRTPQQRQGRHVRSGALAAREQGNTPTAAHTVRSTGVQRRRSQQTGMLVTASRLANNGAQAASQHTGQLSGLIHTSASTSVRTNVRICSIIAWWRSTGRAELRTPGVRDVCKRRAQSRLQANAQLIEGVIYACWINTSRIHTVLLHAASVSGHASSHHCRSDVRHLRDAQHSTVQHSTALRHMYFG